MNAGNLLINLKVLENESNAWRIAQSEEKGFRCQDQGKRITEKGKD
jgi:hypothetical protein